MRPLSLGAKGLELSHGGTVSSQSRTRVDAGTQATTHRTALFSRQGRRLVGQKPGFKARTALAPHKGWVLRPGAVWPAAQPLGWTESDVQSSTLGPRCYSACYGIPTTVKETAGTGHACRFRTKRILRNPVLLGLAIRALDEARDALAAAVRCF